MLAPAHHGIGNHSMFASFRNSTHCVCSLDSEQRKYSGHDSSKCSSYPIKQDLYKKKSRDQDVFQIFYGQKI